MSFACILPISKRGYGLDFASNRHVLAIGVALAGIRARREIVKVNPSVASFVVVKLLADWIPWLVHSAKGRVLLPCPFIAVTEAVTALGRLVGALIDSPLVSQLMRDVLENEPRYIQIGKARNAVLDVIFHSRNEDVREIRPDADAGLANRR